MIEPIVDARPRLESIDELSASALLPLDAPSRRDDGPARTLARYEDCPADPTVRRLPDFAILDDSPTVPRARHAPPEERPAPARAAPGSSDLASEAAAAPPALASAPPTTRAPAPSSLPAADPAQGATPLQLRRPVTLLPPPRSSRPPAPSPAIRRSARANAKDAVARALPPLPLPPRRSESMLARSMQKDLARPVPTLEWATGAAVPPLDADDTERTSVMPVTRAVPGARKKLATLVPALVGGLLGLALFVGLYLGLQPSRPELVTGRKDALLVTVAGPGGGAVESPHVFIDGVRRCESSPCLVTGLSEGLHFVTVAAPSFSTTSPRVVRISDREPSLLHVELAKEPAPIPMRSPEPMASVADLPPASEPPPAPPPAPRPPSPAVAPGSGFLNLNSIPASAVVLDGQPLGRTPKLNVAVKPGPHVVVFAHPEQGRRARTVSVGAGERQTVAVMF